MFSDLISFLQIQESLESYKNLDIHLLYCLVHDLRQFNPDKTFSVIFCHFLTIYLPTYLSIYLSIYQSIYIYIYISISISIYLPIHVLNQQLLLPYHQSRAAVLNTNRLKKLREKCISHIFQCVSESYKSGGQLLSYCVVTLFKNMDVSIFTHSLD